MHSIIYDISGKHWDQQVPIALQTLARIKQPLRLRFETRLAEDKLIAPLGEAYQAYKARKPMVTYAPDPSTFTAYRGYIDKSWILFHHDVTATLETAAMASPHDVTAEALGVSVGHQSKQPNWSLVLHSAKGVEASPASILAVVHHLSLRHKRCCIGSVHDGEDAIILNAASLNRKRKNSELSLSA